MVIKNNMPKTSGNIMLLLFFGLFFEMIFFSDDKFCDCGRESSDSRVDGIFFF